MTSSHATRSTPWALAATTYATLTIIFTWPLLLRLPSVLPHDLGDPVLGTIILWWNAHATPLTERWWNAPYFWPTQNVTTFSENLLGISVLTSPLQWLGAGPVTAYNVAFLVSFPLSALGAHALAYRLTRRHDAAAIAGLIYGFNPYRTSQIGHIQVIWSFWMPLGLLALHAYQHERRVRWLALFGATILLQSLANGYYLLYFAVLIALWTVWFVDLRRQWRQAVQIVGAAALAVLPLAPLLLVYRRVHADFGFERGLGEMRAFSADLLSLTQTAPEVVLWAFRSAGLQPEAKLFFGLTAILMVAGAAVVSARSMPVGSAPLPRVRATAAGLAGVFLLLTVITAFVGSWGLVVAGRTLATFGRLDKLLSLMILAAAVVGLTGPRAIVTIRARSTFAFYVAAMTVLLILSLGPSPSIGTTPFFYRGPWTWLAPLPGFNEVRVPARFAMLVTLCLSAAAALGFVVLVSRLPRRYARLAAPIVIAGILADSWVYGLNLAPIPRRLQVEERLTGDVPILEMPLGNPLQDLAAMYRAIYHHHPVINGWGGYFPPYYDPLQFGLETPREEAIATLTGLGLTTAVVVDEGATDGAEWTNVIARYPGATETARDGRVRVFTLPEVRLPLDAFSAFPLTIHAADSNDGPVDLTAITDRNPATGWRSTHKQRGDEVVTLDLGAAHRIDGLTFMQGHFLPSYPRALAIETSLDGREWRRRMTPPSLALAVAAARRSPRDAVMPFRLDDAPARYIRLRQIGRDSRVPWAFAEIVVYGN